MLEGELDILRYVEGRALQSTELPDNVACCTVDFEDGSVVASGDEVVSLVVFVYAVDVEVVPCFGGVSCVVLLVGIPAIIVARTITVVSVQWESAV